jgi:hypothetical protein
MQPFLAKHGNPQVRQPPYSQNMAPCVFFLFYKLKIMFKGKRFDDVEVTEHDAIKQL